MLKGDCNVCINGTMPQDNPTCVECGLSRKNFTVKDYPTYLDYPKERKPKNNFERLKAMSMEEMAEIMMNGCGERECPGIPFPADTPFAKDASNEQCRQCWLEWMRQEVE